MTEHEERRARAEQGHLAREVHGDRAVPRLVLERGDRLARGEDAGVRDDHVEAAEGLDGLRDRAIDRVALHPVFGPIILLATLFVMFQAVFSWSEAPIGWIESAQSW